MATKALHGPSRPSAIHPAIRQWAWPATIVAMLALQASVAIHHVPWMDEWQALQIALASPNLKAILADLHYEGHPPLWYLILRGMALFLPARLVLVGTLLPIALSIQFLVLQRLSLPRIERLAVALSYTLLIEAGSVSRSLSLGMLLLIIVFTAKRDRVRWIAIALLPMADFLFGVLSIVCIVLQWRDGRLSRPGLAFWAISSALAALSVLPASDLVPALPPSDPAAQVVGLFAYLSAQLAPLHVMDGVQTWGGIWQPTQLACFAGAAFVLLCVCLLHDALVERMLLLAFIATCAFVSIYIYWLSSRHLALIGLLLMLLRARADERIGRPHGMQLALWRIWIALAALGGVQGAWLAFTVPFDPARIMADAVLAQPIAGEEIAAWPEGGVQGIGVLIGREFTSLTKGCTEGSHRWDHHERFKTDAEFLEGLAVHAEQNGRFYFISEKRIAPTDVRVPLRRVAAAPRALDGYSFNLYQIAWDRPRRTALPAACGPARRPLSDWWGR